MRESKRGFGITQILIGCVLSDARFDWLVGNMSLYQENLFQSRSKKKPAFSSVCRIILRLGFAELVSNSPNLEIV